MRNRILALVIVVVIGVLIGVVVVKKQSRETLLNEILIRQEMALAQQAKLENLLSGDQGSGEGGPMIAKRVQGLESRVSALEILMKAMQENRGAPGNVPQGPPPEDLTKVYNIPAAHSPVRGNKNAPVTIVEFVDFQCPFCARFHPPIEEVLKAYPKEVRYILKNFPLSFHMQAKPAAKAAFAAGEQGKYWEMADAILENNKNLSEAKFEEIAKDIGLDVQKFKDDLTKKDKEWEKYIQDDMNLGMQVDVRGTPTFYINGRKTNARDFNSMKSAIDQILNEKK